MFRKEEIFRIVMIASLIADSMGASISPQDRKDLVDQRLEDIEEYKKKCENGEYWSFVTKECKSCDRDCPNGTSLIACGNDCREYFSFKEQRGKINELSLQQIETEQKYRQLLQERNILIPVFIGIIILFIVFAGLAWRYYSGKKRTPTSQQATDKTSEQKEMILPENKSVVNQNTQVNFLLETTVMRGAEGKGATIRDNRQDETPTSSKSTFTEDPNVKLSAEPFDTDTDHGKQSSASRSSENASKDNKATPFDTDTDPGKQSSTSRSSENASKDNKATPFDTECKSDTSATTVAEDADADTKAVPFNTDAGQSGKSNVTTTVKVIVETKACSGGKCSNHNGNQDAQLGNSPGTIVEDLDTDNNETTPLNPESDRDDAFDDSMQADSVESNRNKPSMQRIRRHRKRSSS